MACRDKKCKQCVLNGRLDENFDRARAALVTVICTKCGRPAVVHVGTVLRMYGNVKCEKCDGRKAVSK